MAFARVESRKKHVGLRLQRSVFEIDLEPEEVVVMQRRVGALLGEADRFDLVPIDPDRRRPRLRWQPGRDPDGGIVFL